MREDTPRNLGHFSAAVLLFLFLLLISSLVSGNFTFASSQTAEGQFPQSIIAASSTDSTPHALELRAIQDGDDAEPRKVSQFKLDMTNVVTAQANSQVLVFVTDSSVRVLEAKVRTVSGQLIDLVPSIQANTFSLANLPVGVYTLDVMTQKGNAKAAYEGILVISQQPTTVISEPTRNVINQVINQNTRVVIEDDDDDGDNSNGNNTKPPKGNGTKPVPICDKDTPAGTTCIDEGDPDTCEPGFVDRGKGCEPIEEEPEVCTPDGPPCPPCPEGVEAGWCMDEDEQQDTDDCLRPDGEERFPGCSSNDNDRIVVPMDPPEEEDDTEIPSPVDGEEEEEEEETVDEEGATTEGGEEVT